MPDDVTRPKQLIVEGKDAKTFFVSFLNSLEITDVQVQDFGGNAELPGFLGQLSKNSSFRQIGISIGVARDAENNSHGAFQSVQAALKHANLPVPNRLGQPTNSNPKVNVFIFPDGNSSGMLESLLLRAVADDSAMGCIGEFISCIEQVKNYTPKPIDKAKALAFLASREYIKPLIGHAARAGYWNFDNPAYNQLKDFVRSL